MSKDSFDSLDLPKELLKNLDQIGYTSMTPIQKESLPHLLSKRDLIAKAKTGSGKTAAFGIGVLLDIKENISYPQSLIITPTRELSTQVSNELRKIGRFIPNLKILTLVGGTPLRAQVESLKKGAHIVVVTPGRLRDLQSRDSIDLSHIRSVVLDEADKMLNMGFMDDIQKILGNIKQDHQTSLFSATLNEKMREICQSVTKEAIEVDVTDREDEVKIKEEFFYVAENEKFEALLSILKSYKPNSSIIFCNTKQQTIELSEALLFEGFSAIDLQGDLDQRDRDERMIVFANNSISILVATDLAARGLDIDDVELIINYDYPHNDETYTHRIGRTARAGKEGKAITFKSRKSSDLKDIHTLKVDKNFTAQAPMRTICILGGKKKKLRAGDIVGALCKDGKLQNSDLGKITLTDSFAYVAVRSKLLGKALKILQNGKIKGKKFKSWVLY